MDEVAKRFDKIVDKGLLVRRLNITAAGVLQTEDVDEIISQEPLIPTQLTIFQNFEAEQERKLKENANLKKENDLQKVLLSVKKKFGKNSILRGMNLQEGATAKDRNAQIGGHAAGRKLK